MRFRARLIQEFTIIADDEEAARYAAVHRIARFADMGGIDEKAGKWKARAHDPVLDSVLEEARREDGDAPDVAGADLEALPESGGRENDTTGIGDGGIQLGLLSRDGDSDGRENTRPDEVELEIF